MEILPRFAVKEGVVAMGELGYDEQTALEDRYLRAQIELAKEFELPIMIHTPHRDKKRGTLRTMDVLEEHGFDPARCVIDHNNEETIAEVLERGYWAAFSIYPQTKMGNERMTEIVRQLRPRADHRQFGLRLGRVGSAGGAEDRAADGRARHRSGRRSAQVTYANALAAYGLNGEMREEHWLDPAPIDQRTLYQGNSVLRGGQAPVIRAPGAGAELRIS